MTVREHYKEAILGKHYSLKLLIEFLVYEKKVITLEDDESVLYRYFLPKHRERMNGILAEYEARKEEVR